MDDPKISVIVPVYKVEPYLRKCLDSIVSQTYENLEIILVDDGSPDNCGAICDEYATRDERIRVIHQLNRGLSAARNAGLDFATGDYIGFVDSDDWLEADFFSYLIGGVQHWNADIAQCTFSVDSPRFSRKVGYEADACMSRDKAIGELLKNDRMTNNVWNKLFRRYMFGEVRFPEGRIYEDVAVSYRLLEQADTVLVRPEVKYHYVMRTSGIVLSDSITDKMDCWHATQERYVWLLPRYPQYEELLTVDVCGAIMDVWSCVWPCRGQLGSEEHLALQEMCGFARRHCRTALRVGNFGVTGRLRLLLTPYDRRWAYRLAAWLRRLYKWKYAASGPTESYTGGTRLPAVDGEN